MTRSSALTQAVSRAECTPEQKHQRVIDWLNEVHKVLYKNLDLTKHSIKVHVAEETEKDKMFPKQGHVPVHRLYTQGDHENIRNNNCNRGAARDKTKAKESSKSGNQLPSIPKRHFSSSNSSQPTTFQRKSSGQITTRPPITSRVIRTTKQQQPVSKPVMMSATPRKPTTTFTRTGRLRSSAPITAG